MLADTIQTVKTTGVNWTSVVTIVCSTIVALSVVFGFLTRMLSGRITGAIDKFRIEVVSQLDLRLTAVESRLNDIRNQQRK